MTRLEDIHSCMSLKCHGASSNSLISCILFLSNFLKLASSSLYRLRADHQLLGKVIDVSSGNPLFINSNHALFYLCLYTLTLTHLTRSGWRFFPDEDSLLDVLGDRVQYFSNVLEVRDL